MGLVARLRDRAGLSMGAAFLVVALIAPLLGLLAAVVLGLGAYGREEARLGLEARSHARVLGSGVEEHLKGRLDALELAVQGLAPWSPGASEAAVDALRRRLRSSFPDMDRIMLADAGGLVVRMSPPPPGVRRTALSGLSWFQTLAMGTPRRVAEVVEQDARPVLWVAAAGRAADGRLISVLAAELDAGPLGVMLAGGVVSRGSLAQLQVGDQLLRADSNGLPRLALAAKGFPVPAAIPAEGWSGVVEREGERRYLGAVPAGAPGWAVTVGLPPSQALEELWQLALGVGLFGAAGGLLGLVAAWNLGRRYRAAVRRLQGAVKLLGRGTVPTVVPGQGTGELALLADDLNQAVARLRRTFSEYEVLTEMEEAAGRVIGSERAVDAELPGLLRRVVGAAGADSGILIVRDEGLSVTRAAVGFWGLGSQGSGLPRGSGVGMEAIETRAPVTSEDLALALPTRQDYGRETALHSVIGLPIVSGDRVLGAVELGYRARHGFGEREVQRLVAIVQRAARALGHARAVEEAHEEALQTYAARLEGEVASRTRELQARSEELAEALRLVEASQKRIVEGERLRAVGEVAAGVAHDFNNSLAVILTRTQLLLRQAKEAGFRRHLQAIERVAMDSAETVRRIREFARAGRGAGFRRVEMNRLVEEVVEVTRARWKDQAEVRGVTIEVALELGPVPAVAGDPSQLREALTNLVFNGLDAMPNGGRLTFRTGLEGDQVFCVVADTGIGMTPDVLRRVFEPFFTTKGERGTGLGLSVVHGIVTRHGGRMEAESHVGEGSRFTIRLPVGREIRDPLPAAEVPADPGVWPASGRRILVIDDDAEVRESLVELLTQHGYLVSACPEGRSGLELLAAEVFDLVLTDLGMPGLSGWEVAHQAKALAPRTPVAMVTGWGDQIDPVEARAKGVDYVVAKPYRAGELAAVLAQAFVPGADPAPGRRSGD
jgi:signal transduction histidine kinase/ActR/RegA family two-component response regulator